MHHIDCEMTEELENKIISYAHRRFLVSGIKRPNLDLVANDCMISRKMLDQCFNRNKLIDAVIGNMMITYYQSLSTVEEANLEPIAEMKRILGLMEVLANDLSAIFLRDLRRYYLDHWLALDKLVNVSFKQLFTRNLMIGIEKRVYRKMINVVLLTEIYFVTGLTLVENGLVDLQPELRNDSMREMNVNFLAGILDHS